MGKRKTMRALARVWTAVLLIPGALCAGPMLATNWGVLLLTRPTSLPTETRTTLADWKSYAVHSMFVFGDYAAVSKAVESEAKEAVGIP